MQAFKKLIAVTVVAVVALAAVPALAHVAGIHIDRRAEYDAGNIRVFGTSECTAGEDAGYRVTVRQSTGSGTETGTFTCQQGPVGFALSVVPDSGYFTPGYAHVRVTVMTEDGAGRTVERPVRVVAIN